MNNDRPKISIIMPVYNTRIYLYQGIDSVLNQTFKDFELVCVDDGSTDNSLQILNEYKEKDKRITVVSKNNEGQGVARNLALKLAKGEYVLYLDSDDWLELDALEKLYNRIIIDYPDVVFFNAYECCEDKCKVIYPYARAMYSSVYRFLEDSLFYTGVISNAAKIGCLNEAIYNYRKHNNSVSKTAAKNFHTILDIFIECEEVLKKSKNYEYIMPGFLIYRVNQAFNYYKLFSPSEKLKNYKYLQRLYKYLSNMYENILDETLKTRINNIIKNNCIMFELKSRLRTTYALIKSNN